ncbi:hypothetical protein H4R19_005849, partial [Coemansia spiralis]
FSSHDMSSYDVSIRCGAHGGPENVELKCTRRSVGNVNFSVGVTGVSVEVYYDDSPFPRLKAVIARMQKESDEWMSVVRLKLVLKPDNMPTKKRDCNVAVYDDDIEKVCRALRMLMPQLRELEFGGRSKNILAGPLFGRLAAVYADQLQVLNSTLPVLPPSDCRFAKLTDVMLSKGSYRGYQLPRMDPTTIETLMLDGFHAEHSWLAFANSDDDTEIEFPSLRRLAVSYLPPLEGDIIGQQLTLRFPELEELDAMCLDESFPLLDVDQLLGIIRENPLLTDLTIYQLTLDNIHADIEIPSCSRGEHLPLPPLDSKIRNLTIRLANRDAQEEFIPVAKYLMLRLPRLQCISSKDLHVDTVQAVICKYQKWY